MKLLLAVLITLVVSAAAISAQTTAFTYQGNLRQGAAAANGTYEMRFELFNAETGGQPQPQPSPVTLEFTVAGSNPVIVTGGAFTVELSFGGDDAFTGADRWLEISVRQNATLPFTTLTPRQRITSSPYSIKSSNAEIANALSCALCVTDPQIVNVNGSKVTGTVANAATAVNVSGIVPITNGGTGSTTQNFVDLTTAQEVSGDKKFTGTVSAVSPNGRFVGNGALPWEVIAGTSQQAKSNTGYVVNNENEVTITLPTAPNVGDIVRISGAGTGGWKIAQNAGQTLLLTNIDPREWTQRASAQTWYAVASSADGVKLLAVSGSDIYTSGDAGVNWTLRATPATASPVKTAVTPQLMPIQPGSFFRAVASSADGTKLVAVVGVGQIYTSVDSGVTWTARETNRNWISAASSDDGTKLVAIAGGNGGLIYTSTDSGVEWTPRGVSRKWSAVASSSDGSKLIAAVSNGQLYTSTDSGANWTPTETSRFWNAVASSSDGSKLVATDGEQAPGHSNGGRIYTSTDSGLTWTPRENVRLWRSIASSDGGARLVAVVQAGQIHISTNSGVSWFARESNRQWTSVASSSDGTKLIAGAGESGITDYLYTLNLQTVPGGTGTLTSAQFGAIELQYIGGGRFTILSSGGTFIVN